MKKITFIGVGHMGQPMAINLIKAGYEVTVFDIATALMQPLIALGAQAATSIPASVKEADVVISMLPESSYVFAVYLGEEGVLAHAPKHALLIDSSTIDVSAARTLHQAAAQHHFDILDAPVSGGTAGAAAGTLTFMVGGSAENFAKAQPILSKMGQKIFHAGGPGNGQAAKICNNMLLGITMVGASEAFHLADKLGLDAKTFYDIVTVSSGQCWSISQYCPVAGPLPTSPANRDYEPGFSAKMMLKDLKLAQAASLASGATTLLGAEATAIYNLLCSQELSLKDFSIIYAWLAGDL